MSAPWHQKDPLGCLIIALVIAVIVAAAGVLITASVLGNYT